MNTRLPHLEKIFLENCDPHLRPDLKKCWIDAWERDGVIQLWIYYPHKSFCFQDWNRWADWVTREAKKLDFHEVKFASADEAIANLKSKGRWETVIKEDWPRAKAPLDLATLQQRRGGWSRSLKKSDQSGSEQ